jgi:hypothetical protein
MALHELTLDKLQHFTLLATTTITAIGNAAAKQVITLNSNDLKRYIRLSCTAETGTASSAVTCLGFGLKKYG